MTKGSPTPPYVNHAVRECLRTGKSLRETLSLLKSLGIQTSRGHIGRLAQIIKQNSTEAPQVPKTQRGPKPIITRRAERRILRSCGQNPYQTAAQIKADMGLPGCVRTVQRHMVQSELYTTHAIKFVRQTKGGAKLREKWCREILKRLQHKDFTDDMIAVDEKYCTCDGPDAPAQVHWNTRLPRPIKQRRREGGGGLSMCIGLGPAGLTNPVFKKGRFTGEDYGRFIDSEVSLQPAQVLIDDNYKPHRMRDVRQIEDDYGIDMLSPPVDSPDIDFAEKALAFVMHEAFKDGVTYNNVQDLEQGLANAVDRLRTSGRDRLLFEGIKLRWPKVLQGIADRHGAPDPKWRSAYSATY